jgi:ribosomal protein RSM22 (predicted rRNA methylase)
MSLHLAIAETLQSESLRNTQAAFQTLSKAYRSRDAASVSGEGARALFLSYLATRMPATFAVVSRVLQEYVELGLEKPKSFLDIGAGPGTAAFAALDFFALETITCIEKETGFRDLARKLAAIAEAQPILDARWLMDDVQKIKQLPSADLVIASYSLGEMSNEGAVELAKRAYASAKLALVVIEPGTPQGSGLIRIIRENLLAIGAQVVAPCPHQMACPMTGMDFCHFSQRLLREKFHRDAKKASLPYEDEKYAYAIFAKEAPPHSWGRIIKRPMKGTGHVTLDKCLDGRIEREVVAKSNKEFYKASRKASWGDRWG